MGELDQNELDQNVIDRYMRIDQSLIIGPVCDNYTRMNWIRV